MRPRTRRNTAALWRRRSSGCAICAAPFPIMLESLPLSRRSWRGSSRRDPKTWDGGQFLDPPHWSLCPRLPCARGTALAVPNSGPCGSSERGTSPGHRWPARTCRIGRSRAPRISRLAGRRRSALRPVVCLRVAPGRARSRSLFRHIRVLPVLPVPAAVARLEGGRPRPPALRFGGAFAIARAAGALFWATIERLGSTTRVKRFESQHSIPAIAPLLRSRGIPTSLAVHVVEPTQAARRAEPS